MGDIATSTFGDIFYRVASNLAPIYELILKTLARNTFLNADETTLAMQVPKKTYRAPKRVFVDDNLPAYVFSPLRSSQGPENLLHSRIGSLQVDGYMGYNKVCVPDDRVRAGCWSHVRKNFDDATSTAPQEAAQAMNLIFDIYRTKNAAAQKDLLRTSGHLVMRQQSTQPTLQKARLDDKSKG